MSRSDPSSRSPGLSREEQRILEAATRRILPSDDGPGAAEADVLGYLVWLAGHDVYDAIRGRLAPGLGLLQASAVAQYGRGFASCSPTEQDATLERIQTIPHPTARRFFATLVNVTLIGFLCDPRYGGNRGEAGWRYLGFERRGPRAPADDRRRP